jgi:hypothetical protein
MQSGNRPLAALPKLAPVLLALVAGLGGAFAGSRIWRANASRSTPPGASDVAEEVETMSTHQAKAAGRQLVEAALTAQRAQSQAPASSTRSPQEEAEQRLARYKDRIAAHRTEAVDGNWAPQARTSVLSALKAIEKPKGFSVLEVDCRRTSCVAGVEWHSADAARSGYRELLLGRYDGINCASEIHMPTDVSAGPLKGELLLSNCKQ